MSETVEGHYEREGIAKKLSAALDKAGLDNRTLSLTDLAPLDQFHSRGLAGTIELARLIAPTASEKVLDVGSGLGGPSRYLAATFGCDTVGVDLSPSFVEAARVLSQRTQLEGKTAYQCANALSLPFPNGSFNILWTQHVAMNIADRAQLYGEMYRVLRSGGRLAIYDVIAGSGDVYYPVPWARSSENSFLLSEAETRNVLEQSHFRIVTWQDKTQEVITWSDQRKADQTIKVSPIDLSVVMGPDFPVMAANLAKNFREGRARLLQATLEKPLMGGEVLAR